MKRNVSFLLFLLLTFSTFKLDAVEDESKTPLLNGIEKRSYKDVLKSNPAANFSSASQKSPRSARRKTDAVRKKRADTPGPHFTAFKKQTPANPITRIQHQLPESEDEMTINEQRERIKATSRNIANAAISAVLTKRAASLSQQTESKKEGSLGIESLFEQTSTEPETTLAAPSLSQQTQKTESETTPVEQEKTPREIASLLAAERDRLNALVIEKRTERDAKKAIIKQTQYNLYYTHRDATSALTTLQALEKTQTDILKKLQTQKALAVVDPTGNYYVDYYQQQFETAQKNLTQAREKYSADDQTHRALVYKLLSLEKELTLIKKEKSARLAEANKARLNRRTHFAQTNSKTTSWWPTFGIDPDADCADSDAEEISTVLSVTKPLIGCLTESETRTLTNV